MNKSVSSKNVISKIVDGYRSLYYLVLKKKLKNYTPTIIASDCFGTFVYHNLGLKFNSPTINLYFSKQDFVIFVNNLEGFLKSDIIEVFDDTKKFPVGEIQYNGKKVIVNFMHYDTFEEAKNKWNERKKRVDFSNIFVIQLIAEGLTEEDVVSFDKIKYKNKMLITYSNPVNSENVIVHNVFLRSDYKPGKILKYKTDYSMKKYMDDIDYIGFLNRTTE